MKAYLDIVQNILLKGKWKGNRTGVSTLTCPNQIFSHNMSEGFPLLTTKKMPIKTIAVELEGFIKGITDKKWYQDRNCHIWDEWANPLVVRKKYEKQLQAELDGDIFFTKSLLDIQKEEYDLGPIYGYSWRRFNQVYDENDDGCVARYDQLKTIVDTLHKNPDDRRMVCSAWNPIQISKMALPPCHFAWNLCHINGVLNLGLIMRSIDSFLGLPFNIASYALLLELLSKEANMVAGNLSILLVDCHIYENHIEQVKEQLLRQPKQLPSIKINNWKNIFEWEYTDIELLNYESWSKLSAMVAV